MISNDIRRIMAELYTFDAATLIDVLELSDAAVNDMLRAEMARGYVYRERVGHAYLYALTEKGVRFAARMPKIDPEERCLLLERVPDEMECSHPIEAKLTLRTVVSWYADGEPERVDYVDFCRVCGKECGHGHSYLGRI